MSTIKKINGILVPNTFVTGFTYNDNNVITIKNNDGSEYSVILNYFSGLTINGSVSATTFYGSGLGLNNIPINGVTNLQSSLDSKTNLTLFNSHTGNTSNPHQTSFYQLISTAHTHSISDIVNLQSSLDSKFSLSGGTVNGDVTVLGNVTILGTATTINTQTLSVADTVVTLNSNLTGGTPYPGHSGVEVLRGSGTTAALLWEEQNLQWEAGLHGSTKRIILQGDSLSLLTSGHTHPISEVNNLQSSLDSKTNLTLFNSHTGNTSNPHQTSFYQLISTAHTHTISDVTNLQSSLESKFNTSGGTVNGNILVTGSVSATTYYGSGQYLTGINDFYVTGGTYSNGTLTLNRQNGSITITGFTTGSTSSSVNTFVTGFTYSNNNVTLSQNQGQSPLSVNISTMTGLTVNGNLTVTGSTSLKSFNATSGVISGTGQSILTIVGSGSSTSAPLFTIQGSSGELFSVTDSLTGSLFSVNDISGLPILEVFSDNTTLMGSYLAPSLNTTKRVSLTAGTNSIYSIPTSAYTGAFFDYTVLGSTGARAGNIMSIFSGVTVQYTEVTTNNIGSTDGVTFSMAVSNNLVTLSSSATTTGWTLKTIIRGI